MLTYYWETVYTDECFDDVMLDQVVVRVSFQGNNVSWPQDPWPGWLALPHILHDCVVLHLEYTYSLRVYSCGFLPPFSNVPVREIKTNTIRFYSLCFQCYCHDKIDQMASSSNGNTSNSNNSPSIKLIGISYGIVWAAKKVVIKLIR